MKTDIRTFGAGAENATIWLDELRCGGSESHVALCEHEGWGVHNCNHMEDLAVTCTNDTGQYARSTWGLVHGQVHGSVRGV